MNIGFVSMHFWDLFFSGVSRFKLRSLKVEPMKHSCQVIKRYASPEKWTKIHNRYINIRKLVKDEKKTRAECVRVRACVSVRVCVPRVHVCECAACVCVPCVCRVCMCVWCVCVCEENITFKLHWPWVVVFFLLFVCLFVCVCVSFLLCSSLLLLMYTLNGGSILTKTMSSSVLLFSFLFFFSFFFLFLLLSFSSMRSSISIRGCVRRSVGVSSHLWKGLSVRLSVCSLPPRKNHGKSPKITVWV